MAGRQLLDFCIDRARRVDVLELQILPNGIDADGAVEAWDLFEGLKFGREGKATARQLGVVERFLSEGVARQKEVAAVAIEDRERIQAVQFGESVDAPRRDRLQQHLGIGAPANVSPQGR